MCKCISRYAKLAENMIDGKIISRCYLWNTPKNHVCKYDQMTPIRLHRTPTRVQYIEVTPKAGGCHGDTEVVGDTKLR